MKTALFTLTLAFGLHSAPSLACDILMGGGSEGCLPSVSALDLATGCYPSDWFCNPSDVNDDGDVWLPT